MSVGSQRVAVLAVLLAAIHGALPGQMVITLTDGTTTRGSLAGVGPDGTWSWRGTGGPMNIDPARVVGLDSGDVMSSPGDESFRVDLASGDWIIGRIEDGSADDVRLRSPAFGDGTFSLDDVVAIWNLAFPRTPESLPAPQGDAETLYLDRDGHADPTPGRLERVGKNQLTFSISGKDRVFSFSRDRIIAVRWAAPAAQPAKESAAIIHLKDGSRLSGTLRPSDGSRVVIKLVTGPELVIDPRHLKSVAIRNPALRYLSDLEPSKFTETPLFGGSIPQGLHRDRGLRSGQLLRIGRQSYPKGILVPAKGRVAYALDGNYQRFAATAGTDGALEGHDVSGSVKVTVFVDGRSAWTGVLRTGQPPVAIEVAGLKGKSELAIEVEFADSFDAGARAVFANAMLIR